MEFEVTSTIDSYNFNTMTVHCNTSVKWHALMMLKQMVKVSVVVADRPEQLLIVVVVDALKFVQFGNKRTAITGGVLVIAELVASCLIRAI